MKKDIISTFAKNFAARVLGLFISHRNLGRVQAILVPMMLVGGSLFLTVLAVDLVVFYGFDVKGPRYEPGRFFEPSPYFGHLHRPSVKGYWYHYKDGTKYYVSINSHGFSDAPRTVSKNGPRIALVGDSTTEFWEMEEEYRGHIVLEQLLDDTYEVLNFGVRGYGTDQTLLLFQEVGVKFSPDIVIYSFCINDLLNNVSIEGKPYFVLDDNASSGVSLRNYPVVAPREHKKTTLRSFFRSHSFVLRTLNSAFKFVFPSPWPLASHFELKPYKKAYNQDDIRRLEITLKLIERLHHLATERGMRFLLVEGLHRPVVDMAHRQKYIEIYGDVFDFNRVTKALDNYANGQGIAFLSLPRWVMARGRDGSELMHPEDHLHVNREGSRVFAEAVAARLREMGWLHHSSTIPLEVTPGSDVTSYQLMHKPGFRPATP
jgi:lysophospholipase L1-like esterase